MPYPLKDNKLDFEEIARHWSRFDFMPEQEILGLLVRDFWSGAFDGQADQTGLTARINMLKILRQTAPHPSIAIYGKQEELPPAIRDLTDGSSLVDLSRNLVLPADEKDWTPEILEQAYELLSKVPLDSYSGEYLIHLRSQMLTQQAFATYCDTQGYERPAFWLRPRKSKASDETEVRKWLRAQAKGPKLHNRDWWFSEARKQRRDISEKAFKKVWAEVVPPEWKKRGAPKTGGFAPK